MSATTAAFAAGVPLVLLGVATLFALGESDAGDWTLRAGHAVAVLAAIPGGLVVTAVLRLADRSPLARGAAAGTAPEHGWTSGSTDLPPAAPPPPPPPTSTPHGQRSSSLHQALTPAMPGMPPIYTSSGAGDSTSATGYRAVSNPDTLRGGATIGVLERAAVVATLLAGWPEGLALILAVKGLARYPELRKPAAPERFIIGTFASILWAAAVAGTVIALRS
uniref:hypothetical protein n=1 Tax=Phytoactinopolyspora halotolerans TaxID=1981512 RepID=UPI0035E44C6C